MFSLCFLLPPETNALKTDEASQSEFALQYQNTFSDWFHHISSRTLCISEGSVVVRPISTSSPPIKRHSAYHFIIFTYSYIFLIISLYLYTFQAIWAALVSSRNSMEVSMLQTRIDRMNKVNCFINHIEKYVESLFSYSSFSHDMAVDGAQIGSLKLFLRSFFSNRHSWGPSCMLGLSINLPSSATKKLLHFTRLVSHWPLKALNLIKKRIDIKKLVYEASSALLLLGNAANYAIINLIPLLFDWMNILYFLNLLDTSWYYLTDQPSQS